jgi:hypothetical protein
MERDPTHLEIYREEISANCKSGFGARSDSDPLDEGFSVMDAPISFSRLGFRTRWQTFLPVFSFWYDDRGSDSSSLAR